MNKLRQIIETIIEIGIMVLICAIAIAAAWAAINLFWIIFES